MKTLLLTALAFAGLSFFTPSAEARDHRDRDCHSSNRYSYSHGRSYHGSTYYRGGYVPHTYYSQRSYYRPAPRYYTYSDNCYPRRTSHVPLFSFLFGF